MVKIRISYVLSEIDKRVMTEIIKNYEPSAKVFVMKSEEFWSHYNLDAVKYEDKAHAIIKRYMACSLDIETNNTLLQTNLFDSISYDAKEITFSMPQKIQYLLLDNHGFEQSATLDEIKQYLKHQYKGNLLAVQNS